MKLFAVAIAIALVYVGVLTVNRTAQLGGPGGNPTPTCPYDNCATR